VTSGERWGLVAVGCFAVWIWILAAGFTRADEKEKQCKERGGVPVAGVCLKKDAVIVAIKPRRQASA